MVLKTKVQKNTLQIPCTPFQPYLPHSSYTNPLSQANLTICSLILLSLCTYYSLCLDALPSGLCLKSSYLSLKVHVRYHLLWEYFPDMFLHPPPQISYSFCNYIPYIVTIVYSCTSTTLTA